MNTTTPNKEKVEPVVLQVDLRDDFAGLALQGMLSNAYLAEIYGLDGDVLSKEAYAYADAMLRARDAK